MSKHYPDNRRPPGRTRLLVAAWVIFLGGLLISSLLIASGDGAIGAAVAIGVYIVFIVGLFVSA